MLGYDIILFQLHFSRKLYFLEAMFFGCFSYTAREASFFCKVCTVVFKNFEWNSCDIKEMPDEQKVSRNLTKS